MEYYLGNAMNVKKSDVLEYIHGKTQLLTASDDSPSITILVHGKGGDASHWSNSGENDLNSQKN
jgi:hypothetical protein